MRKVTVSLCVILACVFMISCTSTDEKITKVEKAVSELEIHQIDQDDDAWSGLMDNVNEARKEIDKDKNELTKQQLERYNKQVDKSLKLDQGHQDIIKLIDIEKVMLEYVDEGASFDPVEGAKLIKEFYVVAHDIDKNKNNMTSKQYDECRAIAERLVQDMERPIYNSDND